MTRQVSNSNFHSMLQLARNINVFYLFRISFSQCHFLTAWISSGLTGQNFSDTASWLGLKNLLLLLGPARERRTPPQHLPLSFFFPSFCPCFSAHEYTIHDIIYPPQRAKDSVFFFLTAKWWNCWNVNWVLAPGCDKKNQGDMEMDPERSGKRGRRRGAGQW